MGQIRQNRNEITIDGFEIVGVRGEGPIIYSAVGADKFVEQTLIALLGDEQSVRAVGVEITGAGDWDVDRFGLVAAGETRGGDQQKEQR